MSPSLTLPPPPAGLPPYPENKCMDPRLTVDLRLKVESAAQEAYLLAEKQPQSDVWFRGTLERICIPLVNHFSSMGGRPMMGKSVGGLVLGTVCPSGGLVELTKATLDLMWFTKLLNLFCRQVIKKPEEVQTHKAKVPNTFTCWQINFGRNPSKKREFFYTQHIDKRNATVTSLGFAIGKHDGAGIWIHDPDGKDFLEMPQDGCGWEKGEKVPGVLLYQNVRWSSFDAYKIPHCIPPYRGERIGFIAFSANTALRLTAEKRKYAVLLGFLMPRSNDKRFFRPLDYRKKNSQVKGQLGPKYMREAIEKCKKKGVKKERLLQLIKNSKEDQRCKKMGIPFNEPTIYSECGMDAPKRFFGRREKRMLQEKLMWNLKMVKLGAKKRCVRRTTVEAHKKMLSDDPTNAKMQKTAAALAKADANRPKSHKKTTTFTISKDNLTTAIRGRAKKPLLASRVSKVSKMTKVSKISKKPVLVMKKVVNSKVLVMKKKVELKKRVLKRTPSSHSGTHSTVSTAPSSGRGSKTTIPSITQKHSQASSSSPPEKHESATTDGVGKRKGTTAGGEKEPSSSSTSLSLVETVKETKLEDEAGGKRQRGSSIRAAEVRKPSSRSVGAGSRIRRKSVTLSQAVQNEKRKSTPTSTFTRSSSASMPTPAPRAKSHAILNRRKRTITSTFTRSSSASMPTPAPRAKNRAILNRRKSTTTSTLRPSTSPMLAPAPRAKNHAILNRRKSTTTSTLAPSTSPMPTPAPRAKNHAILNRRKSTTTSTSAPSSSPSMPTPAPLTKSHAILNGRKSTTTSTSAPSTSSSMPTPAPLTKSHAILNGRKSTTTSTSAPSTSSSMPTPAPRAKSHAILNRRKSTTTSTFTPSTSPSMPTPAPRAKSHAILNTRKRTMTSIFTKSTSPSMSTPAPRTKSHAILNRRKRTITSIFTPSASPSMSTPAPRTKSHAILNRRKSTTSFAQEVSGLTPSMVAAYERVQAKRTEELRAADGSPSASSTPITPKEKKRSRRSSIVGVGKDVEKRNELEKMESPSSQQMSVVEEQSSAGGKMQESQTPAGAAVDTSASASTASHHAVPVRKRIRRKRPLGVLPSAAAPSDAPIDVSTTPAVTRMETEESCPAGGDSTKKPAGKKVQLTLNYFLPDGRSDPGPVAHGSSPLVPESFDDKTTTTTTTATATTIVDSPPKPKRVRRRRPTVSSTTPSMMMNQSSCASEIQQQGGYHEFAGSLERFAAKLTELERKRVAMSYARSFRYDHTHTRA